MYYCVDPLIESLLKCEAVVLTDLLEDSAALGGEGAVGDEGHGGD